ncbi:MAG: hypothetical protein CMJ98_00860 [Planctomycetes bacterium]|nr:hypothetical protein [Planctomycetota bacterium]
MIQTLHRAGECPRLIPIQALVLVMTACLSGCLSARLEHTTHHAEPELGVEGSLHARSSDLHECLEELGAPLLVREHMDGALLAWGWADERAFGLNLSIPVARFVNANLGYNRSLEGLRGLVLLFDETWTLQSMNRGYLTEILPEERSRPSLIE